MAYIIKFDDKTFSEPWNDSDVVFVVEGKEFNVHRSILSLQSPVFKAMFNGKFKDATQEKIELQDDNYEAMLQFFKLLYPQNMLLGFFRKVHINDENIFNILEVADKYAAINIIKQCMEETGRLKPENTMRLLPYVVRHELPHRQIFNVIARHVSTKELKNFAPELSNDSIYAQTLEQKCLVLERAAERGNDTILSLLQELVESRKSNETSHVESLTKLPVKRQSRKSNETRHEVPVGCIQHPGRTLHIKDFSEARKCTNCLAVYQTLLIDKYVFQSQNDVFDNQRSRQRSVQIIGILRLLDDIVTSLQLNTDSNE
jgi:mannitol/fructose-specific phosphotransferase system IIA component (Ntr-type)